MATGGNPAVTNRTDSRRARFFDSYVDTIIQRDLSTIAQVHDQANVRRLLSAVASMSASLMNFDGLARDLGLSSNTARSHMALLDTLFLTTRLEAWSTNLLGRVVKAPKAYIHDSGLLCHLIGADATRLAEDGTIAGPVFETFVAMELRRQLAWQDNAPRQSHYRDRDGREVDFVLERRDGSVVAVEVKTGLRPSLCAAMGRSAVTTSSAGRGDRSPAVADMRGQRRVQHLDGLQPEGLEAVEDPLA